MAKDINDTEDEGDREVVPATQGDLRAMMTKYREKNGDKKLIADGQKTMLEEFAAAHAVPAWIAKILIKIDDIEDAGARAHAWRALTSSGHELGFDQQPDLYDPPKPREVPKRARANA